MNPPSKEVAPDRAARRKARPAKSAADSRIISREQFARLSAGGMKSEKLANHALAAYGSVDIVRTEDGRHLGVVNNARHDDEDVIAEAVESVEATPGRRAQSAHSHKEKARVAYLEKRKAARAAVAAKKTGDSTDAPPQSQEHG